MIFEVLDDLRNQLNNHFQNRFGITEEKLFISNLVNSDGSAAIENDVVVMTLVNIEEEKHIINRVEGRNSISLNFLILFSTTYTGKSSSEGLKFLSEIVLFFREEATMDIEGNKLSFEFFNLPLPEQNNLWAGLGAKYSPSVVYKVGLITIDSDMPSADLEPPTYFPE